MYTESFSTVNRFIFDCTQNHFRLHSFDFILLTVFLYCTCSHAQYFFYFINCISLLYMHAVMHSIYFILLTVFLDYTCMQSCTVFLLFYKLYFSTVHACSYAQYFFYFINCISRLYMHTVMHSIYFILLTVFLDCTCIQSCTVFLLFYRLYFSTSCTCMQLCTVFILFYKLYFSTVHAVMHSIYFIL